MSEPLGDNFDVDASLERQCCPRVSQVVQSNTRYPVAGDPAIELARESVRVVQPPVQVAEHETAVVVRGTEQ